MNQFLSIAIEDYTFILYPLGTQFSRTSGLYAFFILPSCYESSEEQHPEPLLLSAAPVDRQEAEAAEVRHPEPVEVCHPEPVEGPFKANQNELPSLGGVTGHARWQAGGLCHLLYIGITNNFYSRLKQHHRMPAAIESGITHIGILRACLKFIFYKCYSIFLVETRQFLQSKSGIFDEKINAVVGKKMHNKIIR